MSVQNKELREVYGKVLPIIVDIKCANTPLKQPWNDTYEIPFYWNVQSLLHVCEIIAADWMNGIWKNNLRSGFRGYWLPAKEALKKIGWCFIPFRKISFCAILYLVASVKSFSLCAEPIIMFDVGICETSIYFSLLPLSSESTICTIWNRSF